MAGCVACGAGGPGEPTAKPSLAPSPASPSPTPAIVPGTYDASGLWNVIPVSTPVPGPGNGGTQTSPTPTAMHGTNGTLTPTVTPVPTPTPVPVISGTTADWGSDKSTYARGETATGWTYVTNTGNVPIDRIDFTIVIKRTIFFVPVSKTYYFSPTGLNIQPGTTQQVAFSLDIPSDYEGMSTAGDYQLTASATLAGAEIGSFSKNIKIV